MGDPGRQRQRRLRGDRPLGAVPEFTGGRRNADRIRRKSPRRYIHSRIGHGTTRTAHRSSIVVQAGPRVWHAPDLRHPVRLADYRHPSRPAGRRADGTRRVSRKGRTRRATLDTRYSPPRLLIGDRNHRPGGRLLHYGLDGEFIGEVVTGLGMRRSAAVLGDRVSVPDLHGRPAILERSNTIIAVLGQNADPSKRSSRNERQELEEVLGGTHGSSRDKEGNLYVQDRNVAGCILTLVRVKSSSPGLAMTKASRIAARLDGLAARA